MRDVHLYKVAKRRGGFGSSCQLSSSLNISTVSQNPGFWSGFETYTSSFSLSLFSYFNTYFLISVDKIVSFVDPNHINFASVCGQLTTVLFALMFALTIVIFAPWCADSPFASIFCFPIKVPLVVTALDRTPP